MYHYKVLLPNWPSTGAKDSSDTRQRRAGGANQVYEACLSNFVDINEERLQASGGGGNGHYMGDKTSLADIRVAMLIDRLMLLRPKGASPVPLSEDRTPNLWRTREWDPRTWMP
ncbi:hypothetical protein BGZ97_007620 [Linnemannia gamsii]|uniref:Uncharacterized protein n=1 Tax=Linnemannia gamsii TaxID=64522 RepID=A0A9P6RN27_9FUNG|nr:hypothetical protein BGZ97_007620 [Linnemannia gamsii]